MKTVMFSDATKHQIRGFCADGIFITKDCGLQLELCNRLQSEESPGDGIIICSRACDWRISFQSGVTLDGRVLQNVNCRLLADEIASRMSVKDRVASMSFMAKHGLRLEFERGIVVDFFNEGTNVEVSELEHRDTYHTFYLFRMYGIPKCDLRKWENVLNGVDYLPCRSVTHPDAYVISIDLTFERVANLLLQKLDGVSIPYGYGVDIFMVSITDSNGLTVPDHVMRVHKKLGGEIFVGYSLVC